MKRLKVNRDICSGCRACEVACVAHHEGHFGTSLARIRVVKTEHLGLDQPHVCRHCLPAPCLEACPFDALYRNEDTGAVCLRESLCTGCGACVEACPFGMARLHLQTGLSLICDLCGGDPSCVARCATGAICYEE